jgi:hypothetical protein
MAMAQSSGYAFKRMKRRRACFDASRNAPFEVIEGWTLPESDDLSIAAHL